MATGMTEFFSVLCCLATFLLLVGGAVYLFLNRQRDEDTPISVPPLEEGTVGDLQRYMAQLASSSALAFLTVALARTQDALLVTKDDRGIKLDFNCRSQIGYFTSTLEELAAREGIAVLSGVGFPQVTIPSGTANPESTAYRLFKGAYHAKDEDIATFTHGTFEGPGLRRRELRSLLKKNSHA
jgi:hypothetical protein